MQLTTAVDNRPLDVVMAEIPAVDTAPRRSVLSSFITEAGIFPSRAIDPASAMIGNMLARPARPTAAPASIGYTGTSFARRSEDFERQQRRAELNVIWGEERRREEARRQWESLRRR